MKICKILLVQLETMPRWSPMVWQVQVWRQIFWRVKSVQPVKSRIWAKLSIRSQIKIPAKTFSALTRVQIFQEKIYKIIGRWSLEIKVRPDLVLMLKHPNYILNNLVVKLLKSKEMTTVLSATQKKQEECRSLILKNNWILHWMKVKFSQRLKYQGMVTKRWQWLIKIKNKWELVLAFTTFLDWKPIT